MGEFNSDDHYIYYGEQESYRKNGVVIIVNKRVQNAVLGCSPKCGTWIQSQKRQNDFQGKPFNIMVIQVYTPVYIQVYIPVTLNKLKLHGSMKTYKTF